MFLELVKTQRELKEQGMEMDAYMLGDGAALFRTEQPKKTEELWIRLTKMAMDSPNVAPPNASRNPTTARPTVQKSVVSEPDGDEAIIVIAATRDITPEVAGVLMPLILGQQPDTASAAASNTTVTMINGAAVTTPTLAPHKVLSSTIRSMRIRCASSIARRWRFSTIGSYVSVYAETWGMSWDNELRQELERLQQQQQQPSSPPGLQSVGTSSSSPREPPSQSPHPQAATSV
jgi:hypothetical protein